MRQKIPFSDYSSTRVDAGQQARINMYPHSQRGLRQFPGLVDFTGFSTPSFTQAFTLTELTPGAIRFKPDGLKLFVGTTTFLEEWTLSTAYDVSTLVYVDNSPVTVTTGLSGSSSLNNGTLARDGTAWYQCTTDKLVGKLPMGTAYDASTMASATDTFDFSGQVTSTRFGVQFSGDGFTMFILGITEKTIYQYTLTIPEDLTTATYSGNSYDYSSIITTGLVQDDFFVSPDGRSIFIPDTGTELVYQFFMSIANDVSSATSIGSFDVSSETVNPLGVTFNNDGTKFYVADNSNKNVNQYACSAYSLADGASQSGDARGAIVMDGVPYVILGTTLYSISSTGTAQTIGTIVGTVAAGMSTDGTNLVITVVGTKYNYTVDGGLVTITDSDLGNAYTSAYLDSRFYYDQVLGQFVASDLTDPTSVDSLNFATAESLDDDLLAVFSHNQLLYLCGGLTTEVWFTSGVGQPPVDRQKVLQRGLIGRRAIDSNDNTIYFLDDDRRPNAMASLAYQQIFIPAMGEEFDSYTTVSDCIVNCYTWQQENFVEFFFPTQAVTWTYHEKSGQMSKRQDNSGSAFRVAYYVEAYNKLLGLDRTNGKVYEMSKTTYQDDGNAITRTIDSQIVTSEGFGVSAQEIILNDITLTIESSGAATVSISLSTDLTTFGASRDITVAAGVNIQSLYVWGKFREGIIRMTTTSNANVEIIELSGDLELVNV